MVNPSLRTLPLEVLERIALFVATHQLQGPPTDLASLCQTCKGIYKSLSPSANPSLYASIFSFKFDVAAPIRRLGPQYTSAKCLADELSRRFEAMQRIRRKFGCHAIFTDKTNREHDIWMAIFMMLENDGKNAIQLKEFGRVYEWLHTYFLESAGGSYIPHDMHVNSWPRDNDDNRLVLWLLCLCDADETSVIPLSNEYNEILRAYAMGANKVNPFLWFYPITHSFWANFFFTHTAQETGRNIYSHFGRSLLPIPPATAISAISGYMARLILEGHQPQASLRRELSSSGSIDRSFSQPWDNDWERSIRLSQGGYVDGMEGLQRFHCPGNLEGTWEGVFTYTEFGVYAAILSGEPPQLLTDGAIGRNLQVWRLREYHLYSSTSSSDRFDVLDIGEACNAFFPEATHVEEEHGSAVFTRASQMTIYHRANRPTSGQGETNQRILWDVILLGEGHSAWGDFKLRGRLRPSDAFITILKEYNGTEDRGRWLYRGYLVGGMFVGRWRDVLTPENMLGYEGVFELVRRRN